MRLKQRKLNVGDKCTYKSVILGGTGATWADCVVTEVIDPEQKIYKVKDIPMGGGREWIVTDFSKEYLDEMYSNRDLWGIVSFAWLE